MQNLHTQIEGSAKFVPTTPGRHVVAEIDGVSALNAATYKPMSTVRFVLLDDAVLVARKRRRRNTTESEKLVADRCWPLNEMLVLDTKDTASAYSQHSLRIQTIAYCYPPPQRSSMSSKSSTVRRPTYIAQTRLQTRRICLRSFAILRRSCQPRSAKSARGSTNGGRVYGPVVEEYVQFVFLSLMLRFLTYGLFAARSYHSRRSPPCSRLDVRSRATNGYE